MDIEDSILQQFEQQYSGIFVSGLPKNYKVLLTHAVAIIRQIGRPIYVLVSSNGDVSFRERLYNIVKPYQEQIAKGVIDRETMEYICVYMFSSVFGLLGHWFDTKQEMPEEELVELAQLLIFKGVNGIIKLNIE